MDMYDKIIIKYHEEHKHDLDDLSEQARMIMTSLLLVPFETKDDIINKLNNLRYNNNDDNLIKYYDEVYDYINNKY